MLKWAAVTFGVGMLIILAEWNMARKRKGGITPTDRRRMFGIFWVSIALAAFVAGMIYVSN
jgi:hypothetical protein